MFEKLHAIYLTGTATIVENRWLDDLIRYNTSPPRSGKQMFFKPFEKKEFIFCLRSLIKPIVFIGCCFINPWCLVTIAALTAACALTCTVLAITAEVLTGSDELTDFLLDIASDALVAFAQLILDTVLLPVLAISLVTRGISTGLQAADIYDYDAPSPLTP